MLLALWPTYWREPEIQQNNFGGGGRLRVRRPEVEYEKQSSKDFLKNQLATKDRQQQEDALILLLIT